MEVARRHPFVAVLLLVGMELGAFGCAESEKADTTPLNQPVANPVAAARAFQLYYAERVDRAAVAYNRFAMYGDVDFAVTIGKAGIAREADLTEIVPGPNDNNAIGLNVWTAWHAYQVFRSRTLALTLVRMFHGLVFLESVSGHAGLTARNAYPGYTVLLEGAAGRAERFREGAPVNLPHAYAAALHGELLATFWSGTTFRYRSDPADFMFRYMPGMEPGAYSVTYSFDMLPHYIRVSDCCTSLMRVPAGKPWAGAYFSNHNSRDNLPDLSLGYLAAQAVVKAATTDPALDPDLKAAAQLALAAGRRVGDSIASHGGRLMTVDEHGSYDTLSVAGGVRPDTTVEAEDLGSMSECAMAYVAQTLASGGLQWPVPTLPVPRPVDRLVEGVFDECGPVPEHPVCTQLDRAWCGKTWGTMEELHLLGNRWLDLARETERRNPGGAEKIIGSFQDDYYELTMAMMGIAFHAALNGNTELTTAARATLADMTVLMRTYADIIYAATKPQQHRDRRYDAALFEAWGELPITVPADLDDFARAERYMALLDAWLVPPPPEDRPLLTAEQIKTIAEAEAKRRSAPVKARYAEHHGDTPPIRPTATGYEARRYRPDTGLTEWAPVDRPLHRVLGHVKLFEAVALCHTHPQLLDCTWAKMGCARADLDGNGMVDDADRTAFDRLRAQYATTTCRPTNGYCNHADLDQTGRVDATDAAFMTAAQGCSTARGGPLPVAPTAP